MTTVFKNFIAGQWVAPSTGDYFQNLNPADNSDVVGRFPLSGPEEVDAAQGLISAGSPVGQALVGKQENDEVVIRTPSVTRTYLVIKLRTIHDPDE
jgi:acyl-CoA reductase-like NAD-dependent aldehyde dehydrogenase